MLIIGATLALAFLFDAASSIDAFIVGVAVWVLLAYGAVLLLHSRLRSVTGLVLASAVLAAADLAYRPSVIDSSSTGTLTYIALPGVLLVAAPLAYLVGRVLGRLVGRRSTGSDAPAEASVTPPTKGK